MFIKIIPIFVENQINMIKEIIRPNHCIRVCDECGNEKKVNYWNIKNKEIHLCKTCSGIKGNNKRQAYKPWNLGKKYQKPSGNSYRNNRGYLCYYIGDKDYKGGYVTEHRILMELHLNRRLKQDEIIHHIDGCKDNNNLSNLIICNGHKEHRDIHNNLENVSMELVNLGIIKFNKQTKKYFLDPNIRNNISKLLELLENPTLYLRQEDNQQQSLRLINMSNEECSTTIQKWSTLK